MKILFVCKYNRFRSRIAESYFNKLNKNKKIKAVSAGLIKGKPTPLKTIKTAKSFGINIRGKTKPLEEGLLESKDLKYIIITADDVPKDIFKRFNKKIILWKIKDASAKRQEDVKNRIKEIIKRINQLNKNLKRK